MGVENQAVSFANIIPGFLNCQRAGALPGCKYEFDNPDRQCAKGRQGKKQTNKQTNKYLH